MTDNLLTPETEDETTVVVMKPDTLPEKFWDPQTGEIRMDELIQSYIALEKKLSTMVSTDGDKSRLYKALGVPDSPDQYEVKCDHGLFTADADLNTRLHAEGFTHATGADGL